MVAEKKSPIPTEIVAPSAKKPEHANISEAKILNLAKPPLMPSKPPVAAQNKEQVLKVKVEKVVQPKVYESQKAINKPIIKSGGFNYNI